MRQVVPVERGTKNRFNDVVKAGQVIARVDPEAYIAAVKKVRTALNVAKATTGLSQAALQRAKAAIENARIASKAGEADLAAAQAKQDEAERDVQRNTLLSRTSGQGFPRRVSAARQPAVQVADYPDVIEVETMSGKISV